MRRVDQGSSGTEPNRPYREYPHLNFLSDLRKYTAGNDLQVTECWRDATTVEVNLSTSVTEKVGGEVDRCDIGLRAVNDIAGRSTVKVEQSVTRLACLNGLTWDPYKTGRQTYHQGDEEKFRERGTCGRRQRRRGSTAPQECRRFWNGSGQKTSR